MASVTKTAHALGAPERGLRPPDVCYARSSRARDQASPGMRHFAAKDRTFETVRLNQGTASRTVLIRR